MTMISDIKSAMEKNKINNTVIKVLNPDHGKQVISWFKSHGARVGNRTVECCESNNDRNIYYGVINGIFDNYPLLYFINKDVEIVELPIEEIKTKDMIPTADEYLYLDQSISIEETMIRFAKMHVQEALKQASENAETTFDSANNIVPDRELILKAYALDNIK